MNKERLVEMLRQWESRASAIENGMQRLLGNSWYSSLSDEDRKRYCVAQAEYTVLRGCANELANVLRIETR